MDLLRQSLEPAVLVTAAITVVFFFAASRAGDLTARVRDRIGR